MIKTIEDLKNALDEINIKYAKFCQQYYLDEVDKDASTSMVADHYDRFKKLSPKSPERIAAYINYFVRTYRKDGTHTQADRSAAWDLFIELDTRVVTKPLDCESGIDESALKSLHDLFQLHRSIAKNHGPNCKNYYLLSSLYFDKYIRPFTSKWHKVLNEENSVSFRIELVELQLQVNELKTKLQAIIG